MEDLMQTWTAAARTAQEEQSEAAAKQRRETDEALMASLGAVLQQWAEEVSSVARQAAGLHDLASEVAPARAAERDARTRLAALHDDLESLQQKQLSLLKEAMSEERAATARAQRAFEDALRTKYESLAGALQADMAAEHQARLSRSFQEIAISARLESERASQSLQALRDEQTGSLARGAFEALVETAREQWRREEEERAEVAALQARRHYDAVLGHVQDQLALTLSAQAEADKQWRDDVSARASQQASLVQSFEARCEHLYAQRHKEFAEKTVAALHTTQAQLELEARGRAQDRAALDSRLRRARLACLRWRSDVQRSCEQHYRSALDALEGRYEGLLAEAGRELEEARRATLAPSPGNRDALLGELRTASLTTEETVAVLVQILDAAEPTPQLAARFETVRASLQSRARGHGK